MKLLGLMTLLAIVTGSNVFPPEPFQRSVYAFETRLSGGRLDKLSARAFSGEPSGHAFSPGDSTDVTLSENDNAATITVSFQDGAGGYSGTRDTRLHVNPSKKNFGSETTLEVDSRPLRSSLLYWDVADIPSGSVIESVEITLNVMTGSSDDFEFYELKRGWVEGEATWDEYASGLNWQVAGADGADDRGSTVLGSVLAPNIGSHTLSLNASGIAVVQSWVDSPASNHGLILLDYLDATSGIQLASREAAVVAERPKLTVTYNTGNLSVLTIGDVTVTEGNAGMVDAAFNVTLSPSSTNVVTMDYETTDGTAMAGSDYAAASGQIVFQPGETGQTVTVSVNGDALDEADETFLVNLSSAVNAVITDGQGQGTITDDDPSPSLSIDDASADEDAGTMTFTVSLSTVSGLDVSVDFTTSDGTAVAPGDYAAATGTLTIAAGSSSGTIVVSLIDDASHENAESFAVILSNAVNASLSDTQGQGTITDADPPPSISINDASAYEGAGVMTFTVSLSAVSGLDVNVDFATSDGTAIAPGDYTVTTGTLVIPAGSGTGTIDVSIVDDTDDESPETFAVNLSNPVNATIADGQGTGTINDNEGIPSLAIDDVTVTEGTGATVDATFTVALSPASPVIVTLDYGTADETATADDDYAAVSGQVSFQPGETTQVVTVTVNGDALDEADETFLVYLTNPVNAAISDNQGQGTITDDDAAPSLSINDVSVDEGAGVLTFTVSLSAVSGREVSVDFASADGTAIAPGDYTATSGTLIIPAGLGSGAITFGNIGDFGQAGPEEESVANMLLAMNPDFITTNGDNNYPDGEEATWAENVLQYYGSYVDAVDVNANRFFATLGNHDYHVFPSAFLNGLALPEGQGNERYYDFVKGPVHFFAIDSNSEQPDGRSSTSIQGQWLQAKLAESTSIWNIVYMHHSPWSSGTHHGSSSTMQWPYDAWGADAVFSAHEHNYERVLKDEDGDGKPIVYFVNGIGGRNIYDFGTPISGSEVRYNNDFGAMFISATRESIVYEFYSISEGLVDRYEVTSTGKPPATSIAADIIDDAEVENAETFIINLSNPVNATIADGQGTATIDDDDGLPITVSFQDGVNGYTGTWDAKLLSGTPDANYGTAPELEIDGSPDNSALLRWDLSDIPPGSTIQSVDVTVNVTNTSRDSYELYEVLRPWSENGATWNAYVSGQSWEIAGANGSLDRGFTALGSLSGPQRGLFTASLNTAGLAVVQSWVDTPSSNHGFIVLDYLDAANGLDISSREAGTIADRPKLTVTYTGPVNPVMASMSNATETMPHPKGMLLAEEAGSLAEMLPETVTLNPNYPDPFNQETRIEYALPAQARVRLTIYNVMGQEVGVLVDGIQDAGFKTVIWNGRDDSGREIGSGVYFARLVVGQQSFVEMMVLQK